jgi:hypothetical protein
MLDVPQDESHSPARASALAHAVLERAAFPVARVEGRLTRLRDLRFAYDWPAPPFGADVELDASGRPARERAYL